MQGRRVAVTGLGVVASCGSGAEAFWAGLLAETGIAISSLLPILRNVNHEAATTLCAALNKPYVEPNWIVDKFLEFLHKAHDELEKDRVLRCLAAAHQLYA